jgi:hypothetical protein
MRGGGEHKKGVNGMDIRRMKIIRKKRRGDEEDIGTWRGRGQKAIRG